LLHARGYSFEPGIPFISQDSRLKYDNVHLRIVLVLRVLVPVLEQKHRTAEDEDDDEDEYDDQARE
jgi:hypothetical protein